MKGWRMKIHVDGLMDKSRREVEGGRDGWTD